MSKSAKSTPLSTQGPEPGAGGMPIGSNGRAALLLSGGIDSPVAGWMMAKRGLELVGVHFFSYPYTSERAKEKVLELGRKLTVWCGRYTYIYSWSCRSPKFRRKSVKSATKSCSRSSCGAL